MLNIIKRTAAALAVAGFEDISDLWESEGFSESLASTESAMTIDGKQWGVPYTAMTFITI